MEEHTVLTNIELSEIQLKRIEEETTHYNSLVEKMPIYKQLDNLESRCKFWHENKIFLNSWKNLFGNIKFKKLKKLPCLPKGGYEYRYYEEWLLRLKCKELEGSSWGGFEVISFENLLEKFKKKLINGISKKFAIESEIQLEKIKLTDYLDKPRIQPNEFYTKFLYANLMANEPLYKILPKEAKGFKKKGNKLDRVKVDAIFKLAIVWDRAKYILYLEKLKEDLENGILLQSNTENIEEEKAMIIVHENKKLPKNKTLNKYRLKHNFIQHQIEIVWNKENRKTEKKLDELYLVERKKYVEKNEITLSQLNRELNQVDSWNRLKEHIIKYYGQFV